VRGGPRGLDALRELAAAGADARALATAVAWAAGERLTESPAAGDAAAAAEAAAALDPAKVAAAAEALGLPWLPATFALAAPLGPARCLAARWMLAQIVRGEDPAKFAGFVETIAGVAKGYVAVIAVFHGPEPGVLPFFFFFFFFFLSFSFFNF
jgi:hypothetical protein